MSTDHDTPPNGDPQEVVGPAGCNATKDDVSAAAKEVSQGPDDPSTYELRDELAESFPVESIAVGISPDDGLPLPMDTQGGLMLAPKFGPATVVCLEDVSQYVEVFDEDEADFLEYSRASSKCSPIPNRVWESVFALDDLDAQQVRVGGIVMARSMWNGDGTERERRVFEPSRVKMLWGASFVESFEGLLLVMPKRLRCKHYKRLVFANDDTTFKPGEFGHMVLYRNCEARRSVGGALMSVKDDAVYACDHRVPRDRATTEQYLDAPDRNRIAAKIEMVPLFNLKNNEEK